MKHAVKFTAITLLTVSFGCQKDHSPVSPQSRPPNLVIDFHQAEVSVDITPGYIEERQYYRYRTGYHFENADGFIEYIEYDFGDRQIRVLRNFAPGFAVKSGRRDSLVQEGFGTVLLPRGSRAVLQSEFRGFYILNKDNGEERQTEDFSFTLYDTVTVNQHSESELPEENSHQITSGSSSNRLPHWSPDGRFLVYESRLSSHDFDIWTIPAAGGLPTQITASHHSEQPDWSPDGAEIVFRSSFNGAFDIWKINLTNNNSFSLTNDTGIDIDPSWSPDGRRIAFASDRNGNGQIDIWTISAAGSMPLQLTGNPATDLSPVWSPDGTEIAFSSNRSGSWDIWKIPAQGGIAARITFEPSNELAPAWSPDGKHIAFQSDRAGSMDIWIVSLADGKLRQITVHSGEEGNPAWSPDGMRLSFDAHRRGSTQVWIIEI